MPVNKHRLEFLRKYVFLQVAHFITSLNRIGAVDCALSLADSGWKETVCGLVFKTGGIIICTCCQLPTILTGAIR